MATNSPVGGPQGRVPLISAAGVVAVLIAQAVVVGIADFTVFSASGSQGSASMLLGILNGLVQFVPFGVGVFVGLRYVAPVVGSDGWGRVAARATVAAALGAAAVLIVAAVVSSYAIIAVDGNVFGYSFINATVDRGNLVNELGGAIVTGLGALVEWLPIVILACVSQKLWLAAHTVPTATVRVSDAEKL